LDLAEQEACLSVVKLPFAATCLLALTAPSLAQGGTLTVTTSAAATTVTYQAAAGEINRLSVSGYLDTNEGDHPYLLRVSGSPIALGASDLECVSEVSSVVCVLPSRRPVEVMLALGDMDDRADASRSCDFFPDPGFNPGPGPCTVTINGGDGDDSMFGSERGSCYWVDPCVAPPSRNVLIGGPGNDLLDAHWGPGRASLAGGVGDDTLIAGPRSDSLNGGDGLDILLGQGARDQLDGGDGADTLIGGAGIDTVSYADRTSRVEVILDGNRNDGQVGEGDQLIEVENAIGGQAGDYLVGDGRANLFRGRGGSDLIVTGGGNDVLDGGANRDRLRGGAGNDRLRARDGYADRVAGGPGFDRARINPSLDETSSIERLL
jgi:hypothetical protein